MRQESGENDICKTDGGERNVKQPEEEARKAESPEISTE